jgi:hypothetical protein
MRIIREKVNDARVAATFFGQHVTLFLTSLAFPSFARRL